MTYNYIAKETIFEGYRFIIIKFDGVEGYNFISDSKFDKISKINTKKRILKNLNDFLGIGFFNTLPSVYNIEKTHKEDFEDILKNLGKVNYYKCEGIVYDISEKFR